MGGFGLEIEDLRRSVSLFPGDSSFLMFGVVVHS